jgi:hypothetical protein
VRRCDAQTDDDDAEENGPVKEIEQSIVELRLGLVGPPSDDIGQGPVDEPSKDELEEDDRGRLYPFIGDERIHKSEPLLAIE